MLNPIPCKGCQQILSIDCFYVDKTKPSGLRGKCKQCLANDAQVRKDQDPEAWRKNAAKRALDSYYRNHEASKERNRLKERNRRQEHGNRVRELEALGRERNRQTLRDRAKARRLANLPAYKAIESAKAKLPRNRARLINQGMKRRAKNFGCQIFVVTVDEIIKLYSLPCVICQSTEQMHIDHIVPLSRQGSHSIGNLQPMCAPHNLSKGSMTMTEWQKSGLV